MLKYTKYLIKVIPKARSSQSFKRNLASKSSSLCTTTQYPTEDDLFWCFYIIYLGFQRYEIIHNFFTEEKNIKIQFVELVRKHKNILKQNKWKRNRIENELVHEKKISLTTFICLCVITNCGFVLIDHRKVLDKRVHTDMENTHLIIKEGYEWSLYTEDDKENKIQKALETMWIIDSIEKPLRAISSYKVKDLRTICQKLSLSSEKKKKKELYQTIIENL